MRNGQEYRVLLATMVLFTVAAGDFWRNLLSWYGWAAICVALTGAIVVELARRRPALGRLPAPLIAFLAIAVASLTWSAYPGATVAGLAATLVTTAGGVFLAVCLVADQLIDALSAALRWVLGLSLLFEAVVAVFVRRPVLPLFPAFDTEQRHIPDAFAWSRAELLTGGPIQGIVGNANLLAMVALLALLTFGAQTAADRMNRSSGFAWIGLAVLTLGLTRSGTVLAGAVAVAAVMMVTLHARRLSAGARNTVALAAAGVVAAVAAACFLFTGPVVEFLRRTIDLSHRLDVWWIVKNLAEERPIAGWGWVSHWAPWVEPFDDLVVINGVTYLQAHNAWLDVSMQLGWAGLLAFGALVATVLVRSWRLATDPAHALRTEGDRHPATQLLPLLFVTALLLQSLGESRLLVELGWTLLVVLAIRTKPQPFRISPPTPEPAAEVTR
jgi:exopolysaccharide production protein ExoQ